MGRILFLLTTKDPRRKEGALSWHPVRGHQPAIWNTSGYCMRLDNYATFFVRPDLRMQNLEFTDFHYS